MGTPVTGFLIQINWNVKIESKCAVPIHELGYQIKYKVEREWDQQ